MLHFGLRLVVQHVFQQQGKRSNGRCWGTSISATQRQKALTSSKCTGFTLSKEPDICFSHMNAKAQIAPGLRFQPVAECDLRLALVLRALWDWVHLSCIKDIHPLLSC